MTHLFRRPVARPWTLLTACALAAGVAACGGGDDSAPSNQTPPATPSTPSSPADPSAPSSPSNPGTPNPPVASKLSGTAAVGAPITAGDIEVLCEGAATALRGVTSATGTWQVDTTGQTLPCALRISGGSLPVGQAYHSLALAFDNVNITPLTDLMVANTVGQVPAVWWGSAGPADLKRWQASELDRALAALRGALGLEVLKNFDPMSVAFTATTKDPVRDVLEAMRLALAQTGIDYAALLSAASSRGFVLPESYRISLANNHAAIVQAHQPPDVTGPGGSYTLTLEVTASGMTMAPISIDKVPKPSSQAEFCGWVNDPASNVSFSQVSGGAAGSVVINSCSFSGNVGHVSATMSITSPVAMTVPYSVRYTYR